MTEPTDHRPTHIVYAVEGDDDKAFFTRIGAAWTHKKGSGMNLNLAAIPLKGRIVILERKNNEDASETQPSGASETAANGGQQ